MADLISKQEAGILMGLKPGHIEVLIANRNQTGKPYCPEYVVVSKEILFEREKVLQWNADSYQATEEFLEVLQMFMSVRKRLDRISPYLPHVHDWIDLATNKSQASENEKLPTAAGSPPKP